MEDRYLFKAKRISDGERVIGYYGVIGKRNVIIEKYAENYYCPDTCESRHGNQIHEVNSKTICQCTGLKDKNGRLIWEKNIVNTQCGKAIVVWDKDNGDNDFADCELAWTSFGTAVRRIKYRWNGMLQQNMKHKENRIHPTQKPVALYEWLLNRYAKPNDIILDTHVGSASSLIACYNTNHKFVGFELDEYYYKVSKQRLDTEMAQMRLSDFM